MCEFTISNKHNIKKYYTRDPYKAFKQAKNHVFYWVVDTAVELVEDFNFDYYPDIYSIENVFAFQSEEGGEAGVYLVHRPHLEKFNPSKEDFSFDRFKNIISNKITTFRKIIKYIKRNKLWFR